MKSNKNQCQLINKLYESDKGHVVYCSCCATFHIAYGTVSFDQTETSLLSLMNTLNFHFEHFEGKVNPNCRCIQILTPFEGFRFIFSINELREFMSILRESYLIFQAEQIMNDQNPS